MECVHAGLVGEECLIYLDDIIVYSSTFKEHLLKLSRVFQALCDAGLQFKASKFHLALDGWCAFMYYVCMYVCMYVRMYV